MTRVILMLIFFVLCNTGGELAMSYGVKQVGEPQSFRPMALLRFIWAAARNSWLWVALPLLAASFYSAADFVFVGAGERGDTSVGFQLHCGHVWREVLVEEDVSFKRWLGVILVCVGVTVVLMTGRG